MKSFVEEASASKPNRSLLKVTGKGLIEAANAVAEMVQPISKAVKVVLSLFGAGP